jgi:xanthine dehydrogenase molybdenum-binding subunit
VDIRFTVNGEELQVSVQPHETLVTVLREKAGCTDVKAGCGNGECGACTVLLDGRAVASCILPAIKAERGMGVAEVLQQAQSKSRGTASAVSSLTSPSCPPHFVVTFVEVEVDTQTGEVRATRAVQAADVGTPVSPDAVRGQLLGGLHMGLGYALSETLIYDSGDGRVLNPDFVDYKLLTPLDMPKTEAILAETWEPDGPYGAKGVGEGAMNPVPAAVFNAVARAIGVRLTTSPITPEMVLRALREKGA